MIRLTAKAVMMNFHGTYGFLVYSLGLFTVVALLNPNSVNLLMSLSVFAAGYCGLIAGTTLVEIKVKPLSYMLPGQERSMAPVMLLIGTTVCAAYAILVLMRPMSIVDIPAPQQSLAAFGFSLGLFMLVVAVCVVTRSTVWLLLVAVLAAVGLHLALLLPPVAREAMGAPWLAAPWLTMNAALAERPLLSLLFAALGVGLVFSVLGNRTLSRYLCGAPFMPLKAYDNPLKFENYRSRMRRASFRPGVMTDSRSLPGGALFTALSRRLTGTSWDYLVLDTRLSRNVGEIVFRLVCVLVLFVVVMYAWGPIVITSPLYTLFFLVALTSMHFGPTFKPRLSPMLPVDRRRYFRSFIAKGISVYGFAVVGMLLLQLVAGRLPNLGTHAPLAALAGIAELPFNGVLLAAATIPIGYWAYTKLRSTTGFFLFYILFFMTVAVGPMALGAYEPLHLSYPVVLLVSALCWLPFTYIAWKRCHHDDLLLP